MFVPRQLCKLLHTDDDSHPMIIFTSNLLSRLINLKFYNCRIPPGGTQGPDSRQGHSAGLRCARHSGPGTGKHHHSVADGLMPVQPSLTEASQFLLRWKKRKFYYARKKQSSSSLGSTCVWGSHCHDSLASLVPLLARNPKLLCNRYQQRCAATKLKQAHCDLQNNGKFDHPLRNDFGPFLKFQFRVRSCVEKRTLDGDSTHPGAF
jgi:hypothetical protein